MRFFSGEFFASCSVDGCRTVGLSAGASTPDWVIEGVAARLRDLPSLARPA